MFNSLASYLFGNSTSDTDKRSEQQQNPIDSINNQNSLTNISSNSDCIDFKLLQTETDEDDWLLIDREEEEESLPRTDSEEELPFVEIKRSPTNNYQGRQQRRSGVCTSNNSRNTSRTASPAYSDGILQPLYAVPSTGLNRPLSSMEESWFLTPPPCFTSTGPVNMESSPFENLLIEHPSMSVYHSIRSAQGATESFVNFDDLNQEEAQVETDIEQSPVRIVQTARRTSHRVETLTRQQMKQGLLLRNSQKIHDKKERQNICRSALKRGNKVRDFNSRGNNRQRRSDMQHCKIISGANNNRKC